MFWGFQVLDILEDACESLLDSIVADNASISGWPRCKSPHSDIFFRRTEGCSIHAQLESFGCNIDRVFMYLALGLVCIYRHPYTWSCDKWNTKTCSPSFFSTKIIRNNQNDQQSIVIWDVLFWHKTVWTFLPFVWILHCFPLYPLLQLDHQSSI